MIGSPAPQNGGIRTSNHDRGWSKRWLGSDRVLDPNDETRARVGKCKTIDQSEMALFNECTQLCAHILLDTADIVRDATFSSIDERRSVSGLPTIRTHRERHRSNKSAKAMDLCTSGYIFWSGSADKLKIMLVLSHDMFFGDLRLSRALDGVTLSHRIASSPPAEVPTHTHSDAHFVLVTSGVYVSSARGDANRRATIIYNPPGSTHRDHFWQGTGSFFSISLSGAQLAQSVDVPLQPVAVHLKNLRASGLCMAMLMECVRWNSSSQLTAKSLCVELLAEASRL
jgi:hypothetical protein